MIWTTKDGQKILISKMTTGHLKNAIKMLENNRLEVLHAGYSALSALQGEIATFTLESEIDSHLARIDAKIDRMEFELKRRKLNNGK